MWVRQCKRTLVAIVLLSTVLNQMLLQNARCVFFRCLFKLPASEDAFSVIIYHNHGTCWTFSTVFLNVSSTCMLGRMQSHTDFICLSFLHRVFSNVSANCLEKDDVKSHWLHLFDFFHRMFFKCLPKWPASMYAYSH